jgi:hypothetical protein
MLMPMLSRAARVAGAVLAVLLCRDRAAVAGGPLGPNGSTLQTSDYAIDLYQGPVFAGSRVTGLAGAYVAIAEDVDGDLQNPASPAVRPFFSYSHFDYWLGFGLTLPATLNGVDFFNSGHATSVQNAPDSFVFFVPALNLQWGELGVGLTMELSSYALSSQPVEAGRVASVSASIATFHLQFAHGFFHNQLVAGLGARITSFSANNRETHANFGSNGNGYELGVLLKPEGLPFRVGIALRTAIRTEAKYNDRMLPNDNGDLVIQTDGGASYYLPKSVALPWDLNLGVSFQFGRPLNVPWRTSSEMVEREQLAHRLREIDRDDQRNAELASAETAEERNEIELRYLRAQLADDAQLDEASDAARRATERTLSQLNRRYLQVSASLLISGSVDQAIGVESFLSQNINRSGEKRVYSPRLGVEAGVIPEWLKLRAGSYLEPTRFVTSTPRLHGTFGLDLRRLMWDVFGLWPNDYVWRLGLGADAAARYFTWGLTVGGWYPRWRRGE